MNTNLHIVRTPVTHDSRVLKETKTLIEDGRFDSVIVCGFLEPGYAETEMIGPRQIWRVGLRTRALRKDIVSQSIKYLEWWHRITKAYRLEKIGVIHCHALGPLPIAVWLKRITGAKLVYDAHELQSETYGSKGIRKVLAKWVERRMMRNVDAMITVSPSIQKWYQKRYPEVSVSLVRNVPERRSDSIDVAPLRAKLGVPDGSLLFIFVGGLNPAKGIEKMLDVFSDAGNPHHFVCLGKGPLRARVESASVENPRIHYLPPVPSETLLSYVAGADVSVCLTEDTCLSRRFSLPNKLFESLLAGVPVITSQLPDLSEIVFTYKAGWVQPNDVTALRDFIVRLKVEDVGRVRCGLKERVAALDWSNEARSLVRVYDSLSPVRS